jgi:hypothetical protein
MLEPELELEMGSGLEMKKGVRLAKRSGLQKVKVME